MGLFIDRLPFRRWIDATRTPPYANYAIVLPILLTEPKAQSPPGTLLPEDWVLDTGNRGEAFAWRHHLLQAGLDPDKLRMGTMGVRTVAGRVTVPRRDAALWLVSNIPALQASPYLIELHKGLAFNDVPTVPDPELQRPLLGIRAMRTGGLRVEIDFDADTVSVWTPDVSPVS